MLLGPPLSSMFFRRFGGAAMLYHLAALWAAFVLFARVFAADDPEYRARARLRGEASREKHATRLA